MVTLRLKGGGLIVARMYISRSTWLPARMVLRVCGKAVVQVDKSVFDPPWLWKGVRSVFFENIK